MIIDLFSYSEFIEYKRFIVQVSFYDNNDNSEN